ncbi:MAG: hypothetical protein CME32_14975 [Gimesia sp.]|nr:hypothetical protein [Gimesia sp.]
MFTRSGQKTYSSTQELKITEVRTLICKGGPSQDQLAKRLEREVSTITLINAELPPFEDGVASENKSISVRLIARLEFGATSPRNNRRNAN